MPEGRIKRRTPLRFFLSRVAASSSRSTGRRSGGSGPYAKIVFFNSACLCFCDGAAGKTEARGSDHPPGDGLAMQQLLIAGRCFNGVAEGMAVVENHAQPVFHLVDTDDFGLHAHRAGNDVFDGFWIAREDRLDIALHEGEELRVPDDSRLDAFEESGAQFAGCSVCRTSYPRRQRVDDGSFPPNSCPTAG